jgi:hypothetical protein
MRNKFKFNLKYFNFFQADALVAERKRKQKERLDNLKATSTEAATTAVVVANVNSAGDGVSKTTIWDNQKIDHFRQKKNILVHSFTFFGSENIKKFKTKIWVRL